MPNEIILRDYQEAQYNYIDWKVELTNTCGVESPTGSGKTFVMLKYAKDFLDKNPMTNIIITTGFNKLVFLMEKRAKEIGLDPLIIIGTKALNCPKEWNDKFPNQEYEFFTEEDRRCTCGKKHYRFDKSNNDPDDKCCPFTMMAYRELFNEIQNGFGHVIITNHSTFLAHQATDLWKNCGLLMVDEAHTFITYYDSWIQLELDRNDLMKINDAIIKIKPPMSMIIRQNIMNGKTLPSNQVNALTNVLSGQLKQKAKDFFETKPAANNWIEHDENSYSISYFYRHFDCQRPKTILFSATLDKFTLQMFSCKEVDVYREKKMICDYTQSEFVALPRNNFKDAFLEFIDYVDGKGLKNGLCLSTTITDMKIALEQNGYKGFKMTSDVAEFEKHIESNNGEKFILCGSRALFQGIDIPKLDFVCMNKIPFPTWNDKARAQQDYLTNNGKNGFNAWNDFVVPKVENDILQGSGRLWRSADSKGVVSIFDERVEKFGYMFRHVFQEYRRGIKMNIIKEPYGEIEDFNKKRR